MKYLDDNNLTGISTDRIINNGECGKERPDRVFDLNDKIVILECDENQHNSRRYECENIRMINIAQSFGGIPVYFIRWNPDKYIPAEKYDIQPLTKRYEILKDYLLNIFSNKIIIPYALLSVYYMFYDNWHNTLQEKWKIIIPYEIDDT